MVENWRSEDASHLATASAFLTKNGLLHDLLQSGGEVLDVVIQDEFTHDVVARLPDGLIAVFDST